jgi:hypothetical protein
MYAWGTNTLVKINLATGAGTAVGNVGYASSGDLACSSWGVLYGTASGSATDRLVKPSRVSGAGTSVGLTGFTTVFGLDIDQQEILFGGRATSTQIQLLYINPVTGVATSLATYPTTAGLNGLATFLVPY